MAEKFTDLRYPSGFVRVHHPNSVLFGGTIEFIPHDNSPWVDLDTRDLADILDFYESLADRAGHL